MTLFRPPDEHPELTRRLRQGLGIVLFCAALAVVAWHRESLSGVISISWWFAGLSVLVALLAVGASAWGHWMVLRASGLRIGAIESLAVTVLGMMLNKILPMHGGTLGRFGYLKYRHTLDFGRFAAGMFIWLDVSILVAGVFGLAVVVVRAEAGNSGAVLMAVFTLQTVAAVVMLAARREISRLTRRFSGNRVSVDALEHLGRFSNVIRLVLPAAASAVAFVLQIVVAIEALSLAIEPGDTVAVGAMLYALTRIAVTPGNLGVREMLFAGAFGALGYPVEQALAAALLSRAAHLFVVVILSISLQGIVTHRLGGQP